jgi:transposase
MGLKASSSLPAAGASPLFPPEHSASPQAKEALERLVRRDPRTLGVSRARWRLADLLAALPQWLVKSESGMSRLLARLKISYQRGRDYVHSPDPDYDAKITYIEELFARARASGGRLVALYLDELTYYRQPTLARAYAPHREQPRAARAHGSNTATRIVGALDVSDGRVHFWQGSRVDIPQLVQFFSRLREGYPEAERVNIVLDNWPVHFHPDVLVALEPQLSSWPRYLPKEWYKPPSASAVRKWGDWSLPIQLVPLPTYASWENPIEKLWRWTKQDVLHLHRSAAKVTVLRGLVETFLKGFAQGSSALLRYVGLPLGG